MKNNFIKIILIALIAIFYTALMFYTAHVVFPVAENNCWQKYDYIPNPDTNVDAKEYQEITEKRNTCLEIFETNKKKQESKKLILITLINIFVLGFVFYIGLTTVGIGLFSGILLSSIISILTFFNSTSTIVLGLLIIVFVAILFFVSKHKL